MFTVGVKKLEKQVRQEVEEKWVAKWVRGIVCLGFEE
jgi:hypothetical protein